MHSIKILDIGVFESINTGISMDIVTKFVHKMNKRRESYYWSIECVYGYWQSHRQGQHILYLLISERERWKENHVRYNSKDILDNCTLSYITVFCFLRVDWQWIVLTMDCIHKVSRCVPYCTCKVVVWSEKGELKKVSITFIMVTVT